MKRKWPRRGTRFKSRRALRQVFGGTTVRGISYLQGGSHVLLISGSSGEDVGRYNYTDSWRQERNEFLYFGEWNGCNDMELLRGNAALVARSPNLHVVEFDGSDYVYEGRFLLVAHSHDRKTNPYCGHDHNAIVFKLQRIRPR